MISLSSGRAENPLGATPGMQEPTWAAGLGSQGLHRARRALRIGIPGAVGIFLAQGVIEVSSIQVGAMGQELAEVHSSEGREEFVEDQTECFVPASRVGPWHCPLRALSTTP